MEAGSINVGDRVFLKKEFYPRRAERMIVTILTKEKANAEGGYIFKTYPEIGSGHGVSSAWLELINEE